MKHRGPIGLFAAASLCCQGVALAQSWQAVTNPIGFDASTSLLLMDGTVMVRDGASGDWWRLSPDRTGSYVNGTWTELAALPAGYSPFAYASAVLPDGRVIVEGGEYNLGQNDYTALGAIYDLTTNAWSNVAPPAGWNTIGDAQSVVLPDGTFMLANCCEFPYLAALLDAKTLTWTPTGANKADLYDEEGWTLMPDGTVLTVDTENYVRPMHAEKYLPASGKWISAGSTITRLSDPNTAEIGPAVLRPDGTVFATGASAHGAGHTSIYHMGASPSDPGTWVPGPDIPGGNDMADAPAALLPSGNVLVDTSPGNGNTPSSFYEFNGTSFIAVPGPPNASQDSTVSARMLVLPTGQILLTDGSSDVEIYTASGSPQPSWAPSISAVPTQLNRGGSYVVHGTQFNGLSQGAMYGDDVQSATNYPLVRLTNIASGNVYYARAHDPSTMAVATGNVPVSTHFDVPSNMETGATKLVVVANGIASNPVAVQIQ